MAAGDLTTTAAVKAWAKIEGGTGNTELDSLVSAVSKWIKTYTNRDFASGASRSYSEIRDGSGGTELYLANGPVTAITSLTVDAAAVTAQAADGDAGYFLVGDLLCLSGYRFTRGRKNVRVTYTAGYASIPADVAQACIELVAAAYKRGPRNAEVNTETVQASGQTFGWSTKDMPPFAKRVLNAYMRVVPA